MLQAPIRLATRSYWKGKSFKLRPSKAAIQAGTTLTKLGIRRRSSYQVQYLALGGPIQASRRSSGAGFWGQFSSTGPSKMGSATRTPGLKDVDVFQPHFAMKYDLEASMGPLRGLMPGSSAS